jgi:hypothetical protein
MEGSYSRIVQRHFYQIWKHDGFSTDVFTQIFQEEQLGLRETLLIDYRLLLRAVFMRFVKLEIEISKRPGVITRLIPCINI